MTLVAETEFLDSVRRALSDSPDTADVAFFVVGAVLVLLAIGIAARFLHPARRFRRSADTDFLTLAVDLLDLSERDRRDLLRVAELSAAPNPGAMLLTPANLAYVVDLARARGAEPDLLDRLDHLGRRLFDAPVPLPGAGAESDTTPA